MTPENCSPEEFIAELGSTLGKEYKVTHRLSESGRGIMGIEFHIRAGGHRYQEYRHVTTFTVVDGSEDDLIPWDDPTLHVTGFGWGREVDAQQLIISEVEPLFSGVKSVVSEFGVARIAIPVTIVQENGLSVLVEGLNPVDLSVEMAYVDNL
ncbi:hypothetical protein JW710_03570 [Candidatus Dojkabacteria bacterium]|nr:hypothetical protein [Candidatus Dojkabacteria bacterium]